jgi:3-oxoadipate enol-lactonase
VLDAAGVEQAHVCGISLGGITAIWLGIHAQPRVASLVLANTAARIGTVESWTERMALVRGQGMSAVADKAMAIWFTPAFRERDPDTVHVFRAMLQSCPAEGYLGCCAALRDADLRDAVGRIAAPTLALAGTTDVSTPLASLEFLRDHIPGARMVTFDAAHLSNVEQAEAFSDAVLRFIGDH